jgi:hypothetical protein
VLVGHRRDEYWSDEYWSVEASAGRIGGGTGVAENFDSEIY